MKINASSVFLGFLTVGALVLPLQMSAATRNWIGGDGDWDNPENWQGGKPGAGDVANFPATENITVTIADEGVRVGCIQSDAGTATTTFKGGLVTLTDLKALNTFSPFVFLCPLELVYSGATAYLESTTSVEFRAPVTIAGAIQTLYFTNKSAEDNGGPYNFYSTVEGLHATIYCKNELNVYEGSDFKVKRFLSSIGYVDKTAQIHATDMTLPCYQVGRGYTRIWSENAMPKAIIRPGWNLTSSSTTCGSLYIRHDQTFDRFDDNDMGSGIIAWNSSMSAHRIHQESNPITITLNGTADGNSPIQLDYSTSVIWNPTNDFTQSFSNRTHTMTGSLTVKRGAIKMVGTTSFAKVPTIVVADGASFINESTVAESLKGLKTLALGENARFSIGEAATVPITELDRVTLGLGAKLALPECCALTAILLAVDGSYPAPGVYTGVAGVPGATQVDWIEGAGTVSVINANVTSWKAATSGSWNVAENWTAGVPTADTVVSIAARGADYTVDLTEDVVWPVDLTIEKPNATLRAGSGVNLIYDQPSRSTSVLIGKGAKFLVDGGAVAFTNFYGTFTVEGTAAATSSIEVVSGTFLFGGKNDASKMNVRSGAEIRPKGGAFVNLYRGVDSMNFAGGRIVATAGNYMIGRIPGAGSGNYYYNAGDHVFAGSSTQAYEAGEATVLLDPPVGTTASLTFCDQAIKKGASGQTRLGDLGGGRAILNLKSDANHDSFGYLIQVGSNLGYGELNMCAGMLPVGSRGLEVGSSVKKCAGGVEGVFNMSGGVVVYANQNILGWSDSGRPLGFSVGYGGQTTAASGQPFVGTFNFTGGAFTNGCGHTLVGLGYAKGSWKQSDGMYVNLYSGENFGRGVVGGFGGEGLLEMNGGMFDFKSDMFVGGAGTNVLVRGDLFEAEGLPIHRHDAKGVFKFSDGMAIFRSDFVLGADGRGTLERIGASGSFSVEGDLVLSNTVENAASGATLKFVYDNADGVEPIRVAGKLVIHDGAKIEVAFGDYGSGGNYKSKRYLVKPVGGVEGDFSSVAVSVTGVRAREAVVKCDAKGIYASIPLGMMILVR